MAHEQNIVSLALTESFVEIQSVRMPIEPPEAFTLGTLLKNKPEYLSTADISAGSDDYSRQNISLAIRSVTAKVNSRADVIGTRRQPGTGTRLFALLPNVIETSFSAAEPRTNFVVSDPHWRIRAACDIKNADLFTTSENGKSRIIKQVTKMFCERCVVKDDCLADAVITGDEHGIRGGTLPVDRMPLTIAYHSNLQP